MYANRCTLNNGAHKFKPSQRIEGWQWFRCVNCTHVTARRVRFRQAVSA